MDTFQIAVLTVATIILILIFVGIGLLVRYADKQKVFPPTANTCPDYWAVDNRGRCIIPNSSTGKNIGKLYSGTSSSIVLTSNSSDTSKTYTPGYSSSTGSTSGTINFSDNGRSSLGKSSICAQKDWATKNEVSWDLLLQNK